MPELGLPEIPARVNRWLLTPGSVVIAGDSIVEIVAGGVTLALPSPVSGKLSVRLIKEGETVRTGQHLGLMECEAEEP